MRSGVQSGVWRVELIFAKLYNLRHAVPSLVTDHRILTTGH